MNAAEFIILFITVVNGEEMDVAHTNSFDAKESNKDWISYNRSNGIYDKVEVVPRKFNKADVYYIGEHPEQGHIYDLKSNQKGEKK